VAKKPTNKKEVRTSNIPPQKGKKKENDTKEKGVLTYRADMTVADIASEMGKTNSQVIMKLMQLGIMANQNQTVDRETIELVAMDFGFEVKDEVITDAARFDEMVFEDDEADLVSRPPVVTIMGHVDHGKTTLLDTIRNSRVAKGEAGGITQHIGAYQVNHEGFLITFIDTPGHAAFTQMRARGAQITDIVILVVAADDGVMPQTEEAIAHAKAAGCPIIVAVNKMDKPTANMDRVKQELANYDLLTEDWGGDTIFCPISALKGTGVDDLLGMVQLVAEMKDLKANPKRLAMGSVIEAQLDKGKGPVATLLVQNGTLKVGDCVVVGTTWGKIRTMDEDHHSRFTDAESSLAVAVTGLNEVPMAGDKFMVFADERTARETAAIRQANAKALENTSRKAVTLEELFSEAEQDKEKILNLIIKGDVQGSVEALKASLEKIQMDDVKVNIIRATVGAITDTDVSLAEASHAIIIGFNVRPMAPVRQEAQTKGVEIRLYNIIYKVIEEIEAACKGLLDPEFEEVVTGQAEVRTVFKISKIGTIAGCYVTDGVIERNSLVRILRDGVVVFEGKMASLKRFKDDVKEVKYGFECGIGIENYNDIKEGDVIEASIMKEIPR
jgi:translation initiation factor IF-2